MPNTCENDARSTTDTRVRIAQFYPFLPTSRRVMRAESHRKRMIQFALGAVLSPSSNVTKPPFRLRFFIALKVCGKDVLDALIIPAVPDSEIDSGHCCFARGLVGCADAGGSPWGDSGRRDGLCNRLEYYLTSNFWCFWAVVNRILPLSRFFNYVLINWLVRKAPARPLRLSTLSPYTSPRLYDAAGGKKPEFVKVPEPLSISESRCSRSAVTVQTAPHTQR